MEVDTPSPVHIPAFPAVHFDHAGDGSYTFPVENYRQGTSATWQSLTAADTPQTSGAESLTAGISPFIATPPSPHGLGVTPGIVGQSEYFAGTGYSFTPEGIVELDSAFTTKPPEFVDPSLIHPDLIHTEHRYPRFEDVSRAPTPALSTSASTHSFPASAYSESRSQSSRSSLLSYNTNFPPYWGAFAKPQTHVSSDQYRGGEAKEKQRCPHPDCGKIFKDLKAHMLTHQNERPEKCPIASCDYHVKGFARKYDKNRHTLTHYKGTMVCGFCPGSGSAAEKSFNRADVFKRHLTAVHGVEQTPPNSRKKVPSGFGSAKRPTAYAPGATGKCSTCSQTFSNAQDFYEHLDDCVLRIVQQEDPAEAINAKRLAEVENDRDVHDTLEQNQVPTAIISFLDADEDEDEDDVDLMNPDVEKSVSRNKGISVPLQGVQKSRGLTHSRGGITLVGRRSHKNRRAYPSSWGFDKGQMTMKKRVMAVFDGPRRLAKDDMMLSTEHEVRVKLSDGKSYVTDLDVGTLRRAEGFSAATDEEKGPWISDDPTEEEINQMLEYDSGMVMSLRNPVIVNPSHRQPDLADPDPPSCEKGALSGVVMDGSGTTSPSVNINKVLLDNTASHNEPCSKSTEKKSMEMNSLAGFIQHEDKDRHSKPSHGCQDDGYQGESCVPTTDVDGQPTNAPETSEPHLSRKEAIVGHVIDRFNKWLDVRLKVLAHQCGRGDQSTAPSGQWTNTTGQRNGQGASQQQRSNKRGREGDDPDDMNDDDLDDDGDDEDRRGNPKRIKDESGEGRNFACPFYKRNRKKYQTWRCCAWAGWKSVHRVKEHVYRKHRLPQFKCFRCREEFSSSAKMSEHQRAATPCNVRTEVPREGVNEEQVQLLRSRKKPQGKISDEEKWAEAYKIIFPDDEVIPSPYHDVDRSQLDDDDDGVDESKKNFVQELSEHVSREFHRLMKPRLEDMLDHAIDRPPSSDKVVDLVQGLLQQILQSFQPEDKLPRDRNEAAETAKSESTSPPDSVEEPQDSSGIMDDLDFLHAGFIEDTAHPSALMNMAPISFNSQGVCDMFQKTVVDSLGNFPYNFEDLFQTSDELCSPPDSGYGSLDCLIAPDFEAGDRIGVKM